MEKLGEIQRRNKIIREGFLYIHDEIRSLLMTYNYSSFYPCNYYFFFFFFFLEHHLNDAIWKLHRTQLQNYQQIYFKHSHYIISYDPINHLFSLYTKHQTTQHQKSISPRSPSPLHYITVTHEHIHRATYRTNDLHRGC